VAKKKKSRVPAPPRPVQAPGRRVQAPQRRAEHHDDRRTRMWFIALGAAILVAAAAVGIAMALRGGGETASGVDGACVIQTFPPMGRTHVQKLSKDFQYNSFPPTSGPHYPVPAVYNIYDQPVPEIRLVHNLEHGAIVVQYGSQVPQATVQKIAAWYADGPLGMVVAPLPPLAEMHAKAPANVESKIFLTAWTHLATCSSFDEGAFTRFRDDFRNPNGDAPETPNFPLSSLQPGGT
jgi:Protein of unknown function (DUF3105)